MILPENIASQFNPFDRQIAEFFANETSDSSIEFYLAVIILSYRTSYGDSCVRLTDLSGRDISEIFFESSSSGFFLPDRNWVEIIKKNPAVLEIEKSEKKVKPFVLDGKGRFYFYRNWEYEKIISDKIGLLLKNPPEYNIEKLKSGIKKYFNNSDKSDMQVLAAISASINRFSVITGGPGTGKTTTIIKILALLIEISENIPVIYAAAPTGKAAARLKSSIISGLKNIHDENIKKAIPDETYTIHRLINKFSIYDSGNKKSTSIKADIIIIDETSMADAALASELLNAIPSDSRVILLGDSDQLSSVEAGSVFADITGNAGDTFPGDFIKKAEDVSGLQFSGLIKSENKMNSSVVRLNKNYRFSENDGIYKLSTAIRNGDSESALRCLKSNYKDIEYIQKSDVINIKLTELIKSKFSKLKEAARNKNPEKAIDAMSNFSILCAVKKGQYGTENINEISSILLNGKKSISQKIMNGTPVMISENDYGLNLFNGDTGVSIELDNSISVYFKVAGLIKSFSPAILPAYKTSYALTIHKSQGSEFDEVLIILPDAYTGILNRELFYTAVTRARNKAIITGSDDIIRYMIENPMKRNSGLNEMLWEKP